MVCAATLLPAGEPLAARRTDDGGRVGGRASGSDSAAGTGGGGEYGEHLRAAASAEQCGAPRFTHNRIVPPVPCW